MGSLELARQELLRSNADHRHPFRYFSLATFGEYPEARWVVKRKCDAGFNILFFTDERSPKVEQLQANPKVTALFYHPKKKLQIRLKGEASIILPGHPEHAGWLQQMSQSASVKDFQTTLPPGAQVATEKSVLYDTGLHFAAAWIHPHSLDILELGRKSHHRCMYMYNNGEWVESVLVP